MCDRSSISSRTRVCASSVEGLSCCLHKHGNGALVTTLCTRLTTQFAVRYGNVSVGNLAAQPPESRSLNDLVARLSAALDNRFRNDPETPPLTKCWNRLTTFFNLSLGLRVWRCFLFLEIYLQLYSTRSNDTRDGPRPSYATGC